MIDNIKELGERLNDKTCLGCQCCGCSVYRRQAASALLSLSGENEALKHDIERHLAICSSLSGEVERLEAILKALDGRPLNVPRAAWDAAPVEGDL